MLYSSPKILSPIDRVQEDQPLIEAGADEFYCGVMIDDENLSTIRQATVMLANCNLPDLKSLEELTAVIKKNKENNQIFCKKQTFNEIVVNNIGGALLFKEKFSVLLYNYWKSAKKDVFRQVRYD